jgi:tetratricopeptide (TPR) repeat protein
MSIEIDAILLTARKARNEHRLQDAKSALFDGVEKCRQTGQLAELPLVLKALGQIEHDMGNPEGALPLYEEAVSIYREHDQPLALAHTIRHVADIQRGLARTELAEANYREALAIYRAHPQTSPLDLANAIRGLALLASDTGKNEEARVLWQEAHDLYAAVNVEPGVKESSRRLARLASS